MYGFLKTTAGLSKVPMPEGTSADLLSKAWNSSASLPGFNRPGIIKVKEHGGTTPMVDLFGFLNIQPQARELLKA
jgi:hypothetical protein